MGVEDGSAEADTHYAPVPVAVHQGDGVTGEPLKEPQLVTVQVAEQESPGLGFYCDWGDGSGGHCLSCKLEPCCGSPCNLKDGCYCFWCFLCCGMCVQGKMLASSAGDDECAVINHCLGPCLVATVLNAFAGTGCFVSYLIACVLRSNNRRRAGVGVNAFTCGDCFMATCPCTAPCNMCQQLRSMPVSDWDWLGQSRRSGVPFVNNNWHYWWTHARGTVCESTYIAPNTYATPAPVANTMHA